MGDTGKRENKIINLSEEAAKRGRRLPFENEDKSELKDDFKQYILDHLKAGSGSQPVNSDKIRCPICNSNPARAAINCPDCGYPLREHLKNEHIEFSWKKNTKWLIILGCMSIMGYVLAMNLNSTLMAAITIVLFVSLVLIVTKFAQTRGKKEN